MRRTQGAITYLAGAVLQTLKRMDRLEAQNRMLLAAQGACVAQQSPLQMLPPPPPQLEQALRQMHTGANGENAGDAGAGGSAVSGVAHRGRASASVTAVASAIGTNTIVPPNLSTYDEEGRGVLQLWCVLSPSPRAPPSFQLALPGGALQDALDASSGARHCVAEDALRGQGVEEAVGAVGELRVGAPAPPYAGCARLAFND